jgi:hypothetical protein
MLFFDIMNNRGRLGGRIMAQEPRMPDYFDSEIVVCIQKGLDWLKKEAPDTIEFHMASRGVWQTAEPVNDDTKKLLEVLDIDEQCLKEKRGIILYEIFERAKQTMSYRIAIPAAPIPDSEKPGKKSRSINIRLEKIPSP